MQASFDVHPIHYLPDELLLNIFTKLELAELKSMCLVSTRWLALATEREVWKEVYTKIFGSLKHDVSIILADGCHWRELVKVLP